MKTILEPAGKNTPEIAFDDQAKIFYIEGISTPVSAFEFYQKIIDWINLNESSIPEGTVFTFNLPYFNSASMKALLMFLERIKKGIDMQKGWIIEWFIEADDEFMQDAAESFQSILEMKFSIKNE